MTEKPSRARRLGRSALWASVFTINLAIAGGALVLGTGYLYGQAAGVERISAVPAPVVETMVPERIASYRVERSYAGRIEAARTTDLAFEEAGTVEAIFVEEGDITLAGDVIAHLDTRLLSASLTQQRAARTALEAQAEFAALTVERRQELQGRGFASEEAFDDARYSLARLQAEIASADAAITSIEIRLEKAELRAPFDGTVGARLRDEGATIGGGVPVVTLLEETAPQLRIGLPPEVAAELDPSQSYSVIVEGRSHTASLVSLRPDLDPTTRTRAALFELNSGAAPFGQVAELVLERDVTAEGYWLPITALQEGIRGLWTVMVVEDETVRREAVEVLHVAEGRAFVRGALPVGLPIVANGTHRVAPGQAVRVGG